jgi:hypothetical protein
MEHLSVTAWDSAALLTWMSHLLGFRSARAHWWHQHGARLLDAALISGSMLLLVVIAWTLWHLRARLTSTHWPRYLGKGCRPPRHRSARGLPCDRSRRRCQIANVSAPSGTRHSGRLWVSLVVLVFGGSGLVFSLASLPSRVSNVRRLAPIVAALSGPIYTDQFTAHDLTYLLHYRVKSIRSAGALDNHTMSSLLHMSRGCIIVNEPELDQLAGDGLAVSASAYNLPWRRPAGWMLVDRFPSAENALEHVAVMCAQGQPTSIVKVRASHGRRLSA